jgi:membrane protein involved in colicin uptake
MVAIPKWMWGAAAACVLLAVAGLGAWRAAAIVDGMAERAALAARAERDAAWKAQIEAANAAVARAQAEQAQSALRADAEVRAAQNRLDDELKELEKQNATLAGGDRCGLGRDRVRLLNGAR